MKRFNVRVYGLLIRGGQLLVNEEIIKGQRIVKLPGGGLEMGEGTVDCLVREWKEELNIDIKVLQHFYTTDFYQPSAYDDSQIISIYYLVDGIVPEIIINTEANERTYWVPLEKVSADTFTLPIDKHVGGLLNGRNKAE